MKKSRLVRLFGALSAKEVRQFGYWVNNPLFNKNKRIIAFYQYLAKHHSDLQTDKLQKESLFKYLFPAWKSNSFGLAEKRKINDLATHLSKLLKDYLLWDSLQNTPSKSSKLSSWDYLWLDILKRRKLDDFYFGRVNTMVGELERSGERGMDYYENLLRLHQDLFFHSNLVKPEREAEYLYTIMSNLDSFYVMAKLRYSCEIYNHDAIIREGTYTIDFLEEVTAWIEEDGDNPLYHLYHLLVKLLQTPSGTLYGQVKRLLFEHIKLIDIDEQYSILVYLIGTLGQLLAVGAVSDPREMLTLYKFGLEQGIYIRKGHLGSDHFMNIVSLGCMLKELKWVRKTITQYGMYLNQEVKKDVLLMSEALVCFAEEKYEEVIGHLVQVSFQRDISFAMRGYMLEIRSYYELELRGEDTLLERSCVGFEGYLRRDKVIATEMKKAYQNFIRFVRLLLKEKYRNRYTQTDLIQKLEETKPIALKPWLHEQIQRVKG